jgi:hypothetical protein
MFIHKQDGQKVCSDSLDKNKILLLSENDISPSGMQ